MKHTQFPNPSGKQQSNLSVLETNAVCYTSNGQSSNEHPHSSRIAQTTNTGHRAKEEAAQKGTSRLSQQSLDPRALPAKSRKTKNGPWTKKEMNQFRKALEELYKKQNKDKKEAPGLPGASGAKTSTTADPRQFLIRRNCNQATMSDLQIFETLMDAQRDLTEAFCSSPAPLKTRDCGPSGQQCPLSHANEHIQILGLADNRSSSSHSNETSTGDVIKSSEALSGAMISGPYSRTPARGDPKQRACNVETRMMASEQQGLMIRLEAENMAHSNKKATAELQQITKGMQNMRITRGAKVSTLPTQSMSHTQQVDATLMASSPSDRVVNYDSQFQGTTCLKETESFDKSPHLQGTTATQTIEEVDRARMMQKLQELPSNETILTPGAMSSLELGLQDQQESEPARSFFREVSFEPVKKTSSKEHLMPCDIDDAVSSSGPTTYRSTARVRFDLEGVILLPEALHLDSAQSTVAVEDVHMNLCDPSSLRDTSSSAGVFADIPLSSPPHQDLCENDYIEVDVDEVDSIEWEMIDA